MDQATRDRIHRMVTTYPVMLFMKGTPEEPRCGFSARASQILKYEGTRFATYDVLADPAVRDGIKEYGNWPTIPQLYINGELVGGSDIISEMFENGELKDALGKAGPMPE